jgi:hypothetical protein
MPSSSTGETSERHSRNGHVSLTGLIEIAEIADSIDLFQTDIVSTNVPGTKGFRSMIPRFGLPILLFLAIRPVSSCAANSFDGDWSYNTIDTSEGSFRGAELHLTHTRDGVSGTWSDGTNQVAWSGSLIGKERDGSLYVRFCYDDGWGDESAACRHFGPESAVFAIRDGKLVWYRIHGTQRQKYVSLQRVEEPRAHKMQRY